MKLAAVALLATLTGCIPPPGTLRVSCTAPVADNAGTCAAPIYQTNPSDSVWVHFSALGQVRPIVIRRLDSLHVAKGARASIAWEVPKASYMVRAWASDRGGQGCGTTIIVPVR